MNSTVSEWEAAELEQISARVVFDIELMNSDERAALSLKHPDVTFSFEQNGTFAVVVSGTRKHVKKVLMDEFGIW